MQIERSQLIFILLYVATGGGKKQKSLGVISRSTRISLLNEAND